MAKQIMKMVMSPNDPDMLKGIVKYVRRAAEPPITKEERVRWPEFINDWWREGYVYSPGTSIHCVAAIFPWVIEPQSTSSKTTESGAHAQLFQLFLPEVTQIIVPWLSARSHTQPTGSLSRSDLINLEYHLVETRAKLAWVFSQMNTTINTLSARRDEYQVDLSYLGCD